MCSINLIYSKKIPPSQLIKSAIIMAKCTSHRGPDSSTSMSGNNFALSFNRLEIVGGKKGVQPISNENNKIHLICNGEIFNYKELIKLHKDKHIYKSKSDVEVLLHLYEELDIDFIKLLEGQFAFVIVDENKNKIIIGRDRFGINPLFYYLKSDLFIIASEIKAIINSGIIRNPFLNPTGIAESWFFYGSRPPNTSFTDIFQLPPASIATYQFSTNKLNVNHYWSIRKQSHNRSMGLNLREVLISSVKKRLQDNYKPGVYVSGGLDSSIIAFLTNKFSAKKPDLFSLSFKDKEFDESIYQDQLAEFLKCRLHKVYIDAQHIILNIKQCLYHTETPLIRSAPIPMMLLSKEARKRHIKYVLCGEGADELFLGYSVFSNGKSSIQEKWVENKKYLKFFANINLNKELQKKYHIITKVKNDDNSLGIRIIELQTKLSQYLLTNQGDRISMANSVEQRFPYLDNSVVNYALGIKRSLLIHNGIGKSLLRKTFQYDLPKKLVTRKKQGYLTPDVQVAYRLLKNTSQSKILSKKSIDKVGIFKYAEVRRLTKQISSLTKIKLADARFFIFIYSTQLLDSIFRQHKMINT